MRKNEVEIAKLRYSRGGGEREGREEKEREREREG